MILEGLGHTQKKENNLYFIYWRKKEFRRYTSVYKSMTSLTSTTQMHTFSRTVSLYVYRLHKSVTLYTWKGDENVMTPVYMVTRIALA